MSSAMMLFNAVPYAYLLPSGHVRNLTFHLAYRFQEIEATVVDGNGTETGHIIATTIGGRNGQPKQVGAGGAYLLIL